MMPDPLVLERCQSRKSERATEIARRVENSRGVAGILLGDRSHRRLIQEHHRQDHADTAQELALGKNGTTGFGCKAGADKAADRHQQHAGADGDANVDLPDHQGKHRHQQEGRDAHPEDDQPGLKRIVVRNDREELRDDIGRTIHHHAQGERHDRDAGELSIEQELQLQDRLACFHLSVNQTGKADNGHHR